MKIGIVTKPALIEARETLAEIAGWLAARRFESVTQVRGLMSQRNLRDPSALVLTNYVATARGRRI